jgi:glycine/D-amino acid oxidase-like deaminating enzyme
VVRPEEHTAHGYWLAEAGAIEPRPPLLDNVDADLCVVGGGYLGLWTAWFARRADPSARVVVVEAELCGHGPSGRNGGIASPVWRQMPWLRRRYGDEAALAVGRASAEAVVGIGEWCKTHGVDAWYQPHDLVEVSTSPSQDHRWLDATMACAELGVGENYHPISAEEIGPYCRSDLVRGGAVMGPGATVQPARLAAGIRQALLETGVTIYEHTRVLRTREEESGVVVGTAQGSIRSQACVLAVNAAFGCLAWFPSAAERDIESHGYQ